MARITTYSTILMGINILAIDDELTCLEVIKFSLSNRGFNVYTAESGEQGLEILKSQAADMDLILLDMMMPEMCGIATLENIKKIDKANKVPVIIQTGTSNYAEIREALSAGDIAGVIKKPYRRDELIALIKSTLSLSEGDLEVAI